MADYMVIDGKRIDISKETAGNLKAQFVANDVPVKYRYATYKKEVDKSPSRDRLLICDGETVEAFDTNGRLTNEWDVSEEPLVNYTVHAEFDVKD
jgi:hypothetical protein